MKKRGAVNMPWELIVGGLIALILVLVLVGIIKPGGTNIAETISGYIDEFGDCDLDGVKNVMDKCPCTYFGANEAKAFRGCPVGTDEAFAKNDKQTCSWYVTAVEGEFVPNCADENKDKCLESDGKYKTKCGQMEEKSSELPAAAVKGESCNNCDLTVTQFLIETKSGSFEDVDRIEEKLNGADSLSIKIIPKVKNIGTDKEKDKIINNFHLGVFVCKDKKSCKPATFSGGDAARAWILGGLAADAEENNLPPLEFKVGTNGDYCDGSEDTSCYLKIAVDSLEEVKEKNGAGEDNNDKFVYTSLKSKQLKEYEFIPYSSIEIFGDDDGNPDNLKGEIFNLCSKGIFGKDCESEDGDCDDSGEFPSAAPIGGCLVQASEDNGFEENDCAYASAVEGFILNSLGSKKFTLASGITQTSGDQAENLFQWSWKAKPQGSLLCKNGKWYICNSDTANAVLEVDKKKFACGEDLQWETLS